MIASEGSDLVLRSWLLYSRLYNGTGVPMAFYQQAAKLAPPQGACSPIEMAADFQGELQFQEQMR